MLEEVMAVIRFLIEVGARKDAEILALRARVTELESAKKEQVDEVPASG